MNKSFVLFIIIFITAFAGYIRFTDIGNTPAGLNVDEVAIGYDAYSILKTGKDTNGLFMPVSFPSLGDYKPPVYIYLTSVMIAIFGLSEYSIRFTSAFFGTLAIPLIYILANKIIRNNKVGIFSAFFLAISPWHIFYSRIVSESQVAMVMVMFGIFALIKFREDSLFWGYISIFFLISSTYTYQSERLFLPMFFLIWSFLNKTWLLRNRIRITPIFLTGLILLLPLALDILFGKGSTRASQQSIYNDINFLRQVLVSPIEYSTPLRPFYVLFNQGWILAIFFIIRKYFSFFQPDFLFFNALPILKTQLYGLGIMYIFQAPLLLIGIIKSLSLKSDNRYLLPIWFFAGLFPAAITLAEHHTIRTLVVIPVLAIVSGVGCLAILNWFLKIKNTFFKTGLGLFSALIVIINLSQAFLMFRVHFPIQQLDTFMVGNKEAVEWIIENKKYKEIVFDPRRLVDQQTIVSVPYLYYLFYTKYNPKTLQDQLQGYKEGPLRIGNVTFRKINWLTDRDKKGTIFIGDPFFISEKHSSQNQILKKIYSKNEKLILLITNPVH